MTPLERRMRKTKMRACARAPVQAVPWSRTSSGRRRGGPLLLVLHVPERASPALALYLNVAVPTA